MSAHGPAALGRIACADSLAFMSQLPDGLCDLVYADPPFRIADSTQGGRGRAAARVTTHSKAHEVRPRNVFLDFLRPRLERMHRLLSRRGSLYVHLDWRTVHYARVMLDEIFGPQQCLNEIIWSYRSGSRPSAWFGRKHDTILLYAREAGSHTFHRLRDGSYRTRDLRRGEDGRPFKSTRNGPIYFHPDGPAMSDVWEIPILSTVSRERTGYPSQKPEALLERIVRASSNEGDVVGDFFCGSGTALAVAERLGRRWVGCDVNPDAVRIALGRVGRPAGGENGG